MTASLLDSLKLIEPRLLATLLDAQNLSRIKSIASRLPPIHRAGFEYQFGAKNGLDFQQGIRLDFPETRIISRFLQASAIPDRSNAVQIHSILESLIRLAKEDSGAPDSFFRQAWLEFDSSSGSKNNLLSPSVFLAFNSETSGPGNVVTGINKAYSVFSKTHLHPQVKKELETFFDGTLRKFHLTHIGFMLSRDYQALRAIMTIETPENLIQPRNHFTTELCLLEQIQQLRSLWPRFSTITACFDISDQGTRVSGLECFVTSAEALTGILGDLITRKICLPTEAEFMETWPTALSPIDTHLEWPDEMVAKGLSAAENEFPMLELRFSHFKFGISHGDRPNVKAYFGYFQTTMCMEHP